MTSIELAALGTALALGLRIVSSVSTLRTPKPQPDSTDSASDDPAPPTSLPTSTSASLGEQFRELVGPGILGFLLLPVATLFAGLNANLLAEGFSALLGKAQEPVLEIELGGRPFEISDCFIMGLGLTLALMLIGAAIADAAARNGPRKGLIAVAGGLVAVESLLAVLRGIDVAEEFARPMALVIGANVATAILYAATELVCGKLVIHSFLLSLIRAIVLIVAAPLRALARIMARPRSSIFTPGLRDALRKIFEPLPDFDAPLNKRTLSALAAVALATFLLLIAAGCDGATVHAVTKLPPANMSILVDNTAGTSAEDYARYPSLVGPLIDSLQINDCVAVIALVQTADPFVLCLEGRRAAVNRQKIAVKQRLQAIARSTDTHGTSDLGTLFEHAKRSILLSASLRPDRKSDNVAILLTDGVQTGRQTAPSDEPLPDRERITLVAIGLKQDRVTALATMAHRFGFPSASTQVIPMSHAITFANDLPAFVGRQRRTRAQTAQQRSATSLTRFAQEENRL